jgi:hypothetical protein
MSNELTFNSSTIKYDIKNKLTKTYLYINPTIDMHLDLSILNDINYVVVYNETNYNEITNHLIELIKNKLLCINLSYTKIMESINKCSMLVVIGDILPYGNIYSFSAISYISEPINTIYGVEYDTYLYADYICSHTNVKYAGDKLLNSLFELARKFNVSKIKLEPVESAVGFYEKYGFIHSSDNYIIRNGKKLLKTLMIKYITQPTPVDINIDTQIYISETGLNYIKEDEDEIELNKFNSPLNPITNEVINKLTIFLQNDTKDDLENANDWLKENTEYNITIVVKNITNNKIMGFALVQPIVFDSKLTLLVFNIFANVYILESSKILINEIEKYGMSINAFFIKSYFNSENIDFYKENGYKPVSSLKTNVFVYKPIKTNGGKTKRKTRKQKHKGKNSKSKRR